MRVRAQAPGRVNLIGDHTDYTGGLVLPMAIDRWTVVEGEVVDDWVLLRSDAEPEAAVLDLAGAFDPARVEPPWARYVAGVIAECHPRHGIDGTVTTTVPIGAGLSSSASLEVAVALALGADPDPARLARACQAAEHRASGVPCGIMDQLTVAAAEAGHALLIDCSTLATQSVPIPEAAEVVVVHTGEARTLAHSAYAIRAAECRAAEAVIGPLRGARLSDLTRIHEPSVRARARHVITENERVPLFAALLTGGDLTGAGALMLASHASLRDDFEVSTPALDDLVGSLARRPGVYGARLTGAGFGGCVVALARPGALAGEGWVMRPVGRATVTES